MTTITILADNRVAPYPSPVESENGLSIYIEFDDRKILCDVGASTLFARNAELMDIDLSDIDFTVISHPHLDHTGGLKSLLELNDRPIYISNNVEHTRYYSSRRGSRRDISCDGELITTHPDRFQRVDQSIWVSDNIALIRDFPTKYSRPSGNSYLTKSDSAGERADDFREEIALLLRTDDGVIIISPCSHSGAANIIEKARTFTGDDRVIAFIGGLHFVEHAEGDTRGYDELLSFSRTISRISPTTEFITGHCTSDQARETLERVMGDDAPLFFYSGAVIEL